jgi:hypothetical protein
MADMTVDNIITEYCKENDLVLNELQTSNLKKILVDRFFNGHNIGVKQGVTAYKLGIDTNGNT